MGQPYLKRFGEERFFRFLILFGFFNLFAFAIPYNYFDAKGSLTKACHHYSDSDLQILLAYQVGMLIILIFASINIMYNIVGKQDFLIKHVILQNAPAIRGVYIPEKFQIAVIKTCIIISLKVAKKAAFTLYLKGFLWLCPWIGKTENFYYHLYFQKY